MSTADNFINCFFSCAHIIVIGKVLVVVLIAVFLFQLFSAILDQSALLSPPIVCLLGGLLLAIAVLVNDCNRVVCAILSFLQLHPVHRNILFMQLSHFLDFVEINDEALFICVLVLDALSAKDSLVIGAIEVLDPVRVLLAQLSFNLAVIEIFIKLSLLQNWIFLNNLVQNIDVKRQFLN